MKPQKFSILISLVLTSLISLFITSTAFAKTSTENVTAYYKGIKIFLDGNELPIANESFLVNGSTYMPVRDIAEALGKDVSWKGETKTVTLTTPANPIISNAPNITLGKKISTETIIVNYSDIKIIVDGVALSFNTHDEPFIHNGTTYLPLRKVAQAFGIEVRWNAPTNCVYLGEYPKPEVKTFESTFNGLTYDVPSHWAEIDYGNQKVYASGDSLVLFQYVEGSRASDVNFSIGSLASFIPLYKEINDFPSLSLWGPIEYVSKDNLNYLTSDLTGSILFLDGSWLGYQRIYLADANEGFVIAIYITTNLLTRDWDFYYQFIDMMENARGVVVETKKTNWAKPIMDNRKKQAFFSQFH